VSHPRQTTLKDIAQACGVSRATVSLVVRGSPLVNAATRQRIEAEMHRLGYVYNRTAANLRQRVSTTVALVVHDLSNPFFTEFAVGVDEGLAAKGYVTLLGTSNESPVRQHQVLESLMEYHPSGIILSPTEGSEMPRIEHAVGRGTPLVIFNRAPIGLEASGLDCDFLSLDNRTGMREATAHLIALGHRQIAFYGGHADSSSCRERRLGYQDALCAAGITLRPGWMFELAPTRLEGHAHARVLYGQRPGFTAAACYNDAVALGLIQGLARLGRQPGHDFAVTGFDNIPEAAVDLPPLTTLNADPRARGRQAAELLLQRINNPTLARRSIVAPVQLILRESTSACISAFPHGERDGGDHEQRISNGKAFL